MSEFEGWRYVLGVAQILVLFVVYLIALTVGSGLWWTARALARLRSGPKRAFGKLLRKRRKSREI